MKWCYFLMHMKSVDSYRANMFFFKSLILLMVLLMAILIFFKKNAFRSCYVPFLLIYILAKLIQCHMNELIY